MIFRLMKKDAEGQRFGITGYRGIAQRFETEWGSLTSHFQDGYAFNDV
jgi:hypothetical protein